MGGAFVDEGEETARWRNPRGITTCRCVYSLNDLVAKWNKLNYTTAGLWELPKYKTAFAYHLFTTSHP
jgi:hypothetical protein